MSHFKPYLEHGWVLVPILPGHKGPRTHEWNKIENCITDPNWSLFSAGLAHAYSKTCAIDVDNYIQAREWFDERGIDLDELFNDPRSVQLSSGRENRGKLLYRLDTPLVSKQIDYDDKAMIDFRCATASGLTVQDVLPPSIHPDTGRPYEWKYADDLIADWRDLPPIPDALKQVWLNEIAATYAEGDIPEKGAPLDELRKLLTQFDPNMGRDEWIRVGMALHHETDGGMEGLLLWNEWSSKSTEKYVDIDDLKVCWRSFHDTPGAITVGMLRQGAAATIDDFPDMSVPVEPVDDPDDIDPWEAQDKKRAARFQILQAAEYIQRPPPEWIIKDVLPKADLAMLYGETGTGKSFVALDIGCAVSTGIDWNEKHVEKETVVWIAAEAAGSMSIRLKAYARAKDIAPENIDLWIIGDTPQLMNMEDAVLLTEAIKQKKPGLIIVDTLAAASIGANENSGEDMNIIIGACRMLHDQTGALVLLVHHTGKDLAKGARGWSGIKAAMHTEILVAFHLTSRKIEITKQRDGEEGETWPFRLMVVPLNMEGDLTSCYVEMLDKALLYSENTVLEKLGGTQKLVLECLFRLVQVAGSAVPIVELHDEILRRMPLNPEGRDRRPETINRALVNLQSRGALEIDGDIVRLIDPNETTE